LIEHGLTSAPTQYRLHGFYRSKDPTNNIKVLKEQSQTQHDVTVADVTARKCVVLCSGSAGRYDSYEGGARPEYKSKCIAGG